MQPKERLARTDRADGGGSGQLSPRGPRWVPAGAGRATGRAPGRAPGRGAHGLIARAAKRLAQKADRERSGIISTAQRHTHFLDSPAILRTLATGPATFDLAALKTGTLSVYCALPPERLASHGRWLRLLAGAAVHAMLRTPGLPRHHVFMLLDEIAQLGHLQPVEQGKIL